MSKPSDPARDFTDLCLKLRSMPAGPPGSDVLASHFNVGAWSTDFMLILASIHQRIESLRLMIGETELDTDIRATAFNCLQQIRNAFSAAGLMNTWQHSINTYLADAYLTPVRMTSGYLRVSHGYYVPDDNETRDIINDIETLIEWLWNKDLIEKDFIRLALIEGLQGFLFRIKRVGCYGWPDSFESLKAVIIAYMALERGIPVANESPLYEAVVKKAGEFLVTTFERIKFVKDVSEVGDWLLRGYGALQVIGHAQPSIVALLTHSGG